MAGRVKNALGLLTFKNGFAELEKVRDAPSFRKLAKEFAQAALTSGEPG
jgi:hypothetical protein